MSSGVVVIPSGGSRSAVSGGDPWRLESEASRAFAPGGVTPAGLVARGPRGPRASRRQVAGGPMAQAGWGAVEAHGHAGPREAGR